jgi:hypothetical protein
MAETDNKLHAQVADAQDNDYLAPTSGEKPLDAIPGYGGRGGSQQAAEHYAATDFKTFFGRLPTQSELAMLSPTYMSGDPNVANTAGGKAAIAEYYQSKANSPERQSKNQKEQYKKDAPQHYGAIDQLFQSSLGRAATDQEKEHFGSLLATGQLDNYQLGQFISQLPESVQKQDQEFRTKLSGELDSQNQRYFSDKIMPAIQQRFLQQGRSVDSSGYASALALAAQDQSNARENFLTNLSASQYGGQAANARGDYEDTLNRYYSGQDYNRTRADSLTDQMTGRTQELNNYNMQKQAYDEYLRKYGKRSGPSAQGAVSGAASGAALGTSILPGWGTAIGAVGGGIVGAFA